MTTTFDPMATLRARALELAKTTSNGRSGKTPKACTCGCGGMTRGGNWLPGHDAKMLSRLLAEARAPKPAPAPAEYPTIDATANPGRPELIAA